MDGASTKTVSDFGAGSVSVVYKLTLNLLGCNSDSGKGPGCRDIFPTTGQPNFDSIFE